MKSSHSQAAPGIRGLSVKKMVFTAMLACFSFVLSTFVYFPQMAPFQHFCNVLGAVFLGPWYGLAAAARSPRLPNVYPAQPLAPQGFAGFWHLDFHPFVYLNVYQV